MSMSSGCLLELATGFTGSSMTMVSSAGLVRTSASTNRSSRVYCSNALLDDTVFGSTILGRCGGGCMTCLVAARFAALFHVMPVVAFSTHCLANSSITSETHSEVRPACMLSHWRMVSSSSVPHSIWNMWLGLSTTYSHHSCLVAYTDLHQYVIKSRSTKHLPEFDLKGMSHAFWCYLSVP